jgi:hypothetical protein
MVALLQAEETVAASGADPDVAAVWLRLTAKGMGTTAFVGLARPI